MALLFCVLTVSYVLSFNLHVFASFVLGCKLKGTIPKGLLGGISHGFIKTLISF